jgi:hypothetical protein
MKVMSNPEKLLQMAERHVREAQERVVLQEQVVARLIQEPFSPQQTTAHQLLYIYRDTLQQARDHLAFLQSEERARNSSG